MGLSLHKKTSPRDRTHWLRRGEESLRPIVILRSKSALSSPAQTGIDHLSLLPLTPLKGVIGESGRGPTRIRCRCEYQGGTSKEEPTACRQWSLLQAKLPFRIGFVHRLKPLIFTKIVCMLDMLDAHTIHSSKFMADPNLP